MKNQTSEFPFVIRPLSEAEGGGYVGEYPDFPGCIADGATPEEALQESCDALASYFADLIKHGDPLVHPKS